TFLIKKTKNCLNKLPNKPKVFINIGNIFFFNFFTIKSNIFFLQKFYPQVERRRICFLNIRKSSFNLTLISPFSKC
ncbi:LOW QUALITY PROTEIN: hypothetical protein TorRG33x02_153380, partial [Trema orientale]